MTPNLQPLITQLFALRAIALGTFTLKNEVQVPLKVDLSAALFTPKLLQSLAKLLSEKVSNLSAPLICGVPSVGFALATLVSVELDIPQVAHRKGRAQIEGVFKSGSRCLLLADLLQPRADLFDTLDALEDEGFEVRDLLVAFDWQQGGKEKLRQRGVQLHSLISVQKTVEILFDAGKIDGASYKLMSDFFDSSTV